MQRSEAETSRTADENIANLLLVMAGTVPAGNQGEIVGAFVFSHGGIAFDPTFFNNLSTTSEASRLEANLLHNTSKQVGEIISQLRPDVIFLSTPHGIADLEKFLFYLHPGPYARGNGTANTDNYKGPYRLSVGLDNALCQTLIQELVQEGENVSGVTAFGGAEPFPLRWGEVIPLSFIPGLEKMKAIIMTQPTRRINDSVKMIPELLNLGSVLYKKLLSLGKRVAVVISADLAHTFDKDGPYGFSPAAQPFDDACGLWASTLDKEALVSTAATYVDKALSCGYTGLVMLHGLLQEASLKEWTPKVYANCHPSYYGMMVASFLRK